MERKRKSLSHNGVLAHREVSLADLLLLCLLCSLLWGQSSPDRPSLLSSEVLRDVLLVLPELSQLIPQVR